MHKEQLGSLLIQPITGKGLLITFLAALILSIINDNYRVRRG